MTLADAMPTAVRPEMEMLVCCARTRMDAARVERIRALLRRDLDWTVLRSAAWVHGMLPLLYWHLDATCPDGVPRVVLNRLRDDFHDNARRNLGLTGELLQILKLLGDSGIAAIPFKGPTLASAAYGSLALRQFVDLDLLVHERDVLRAKGLLATKGYGPRLELTGDQEAALLRHRYEYPLRRDEDQLLVELQWRIAPRYFGFPLDYERLWERLRPVSVGGREIPTLSPEDLLLILCVHGAKHLWTRLGWICDVGELIRVHPAVDWSSLMEHARALGSERMVILGLFLAGDLLGTALPESVWRAVRADRVVEALAGQVVKRLLRPPDHPPGMLESFVFHLRGREHVQDRIRYCVRLAVTTTPGDWELLPLPGRLFPLYSLLRPIRLAGKYALGAVRRG